MIKLTNAKLRTANVARCIIWHKDEKTSLTKEQWCVAMCGEVGEILDQVKKLNRITSGIPGNKRTDAQVIEDLGAELCDVILYADLLAYELDIDAGAFGEVYDMHSLAPQNINALALTLFREAGEVSAHVADSSEILPCRIALSRLRFSVFEVANFYGIDLAHAVQTKFNATSVMLDLGIFLEDEDGKIQLPLEPMNGKDRLWAWFGLSRASWLTMPRVLMHAMPHNWQMSMAGLLAQYDEAFTWASVDMEGCGVYTIDKGVIWLTRHSFLRNIGILTQRALILCV